MLCARCFSRSTLFWWSNFIHRPFCSLFVMISSILRAAARYFSYNWTIEWGGDSDVKLIGRAQRKATEHWLQRNFNVISVKLFCVRLVLAIQTGHFRFFAFFHFSHFCVQNRFTVDLILSVREKHVSSVCPMSLCFLSFELRLARLWKNVGAFLWYFIFFENDNLKFE